MKNHEHHLGHHDVDFSRAFAIGIALNTGFVLMEAVFGFRANSLALLADAGHNLGDVMGLLIAWGASYLSQWQPTQRHSYGLRKSSVLAALLNALFLFISIGAISWEAIRRFGDPAHVKAGTVVWVAAVGIVINMSTALMFMRGRKEDLNIRGAFLHMSADAALSAGVVLAGVLIFLTGMTWIDPIVSLIIAVAIFIGTWELLHESLNLALDAVPESVDTDAVHEYLVGLPGVRSVHHLHIWGLSTSDVAMTAHVVLEQSVLSNALLLRIRQELRDRYRIAHATIQFESCENEICFTKRCTLDSCSVGEEKTDEHNGGKEAI